MRPRLLVVPILLLLHGCASYRPMTADEIAAAYEPRAVVVPASCDALIARAASQGMSGFTETETREVLFCQQQQLVRAQEEEAASEKIEAHSEAARFVLQLAVTVLGATFAVLAWLAN